MNTQNTQTTSQGSSTPAIDLSKYVPKEDFDKLTNESKSKVDTLSADLDKLRQQLLSPTYLAFLDSQRTDASKAANQVQTEVNKLTDAQLNSLPPAKILELATENAKKAILSEVMPAFEKRLKTQELTIGDLQAVIELSNVEKHYNGQEGRVNFSDYREDVYKLIEASPTLNFEQALHIAVAQKGNTINSSTAANQTKPVRGTEKPTATVPASTVASRTFKSEAEAGQDAWSKMQEKYGIGDTL